MPFFFFPDTGSNKSTEAPPKVVEGNFILSENTQNGHFINIFLFNALFAAMHDVPL